MTDWIPGCAIRLSTRSITASSSCVSYTSTNGFGDGNTSSICESDAAEKKIVVCCENYHDRKNSITAPIAIGSL